jgi:hypothetical protein
MIACDDDVLNVAFEPQLTRAGLLVKGVTTSALRFKKKRFRDDLLRDFTPCRSWWQMEQLDM